MMSTTCLVLFLRVKVVYCTKHLPFDQHSLKKSVEFETELTGHRYWVFRSKLPYIIARGNIINLPEVIFNVRGLILSTAKCEKEYR